jgi:hypothetical protein
LQQARHTAPPIDTDTDPAARPRRNCWRLRHHLIFATARGIGRAQSYLAGGAFSMARCWALERVGRWGQGQGSGACRWQLLMALEVIGVATQR